VLAPIGAPLLLLGVAGVAWSFLSGDPPPGDGQPDSDGAR